MTTHSLLFRVLAALCATLCCAHAAEPGFSPQVWLNPGFYSYHFDRDADLRENNTGLGVEVLLAPDHGLMAGTFMNSNDARSYYAGYQWRPLHWQPPHVHISAGIAISAIDGYPYRDGGWFLSLLPLLIIESRWVGVNFSVVPTIKDRLNGAIAVQIKLRVW
ncbi:MAG: hypothetical protein ACRET6_06605 [Burkholderiales bacterium]